MDKPASHYKALLEARIAELDRRVHKIESDLDQTPNPDFEERVTERENDEVLESLGASGIQEARMIRAALERIEKGTFGECVNCGEPVSDARLEAIPYTAVCQNCAAGG